MHCRIGLFFFAFLVLNLNANAGILGSGSDSWKEEVQLHDGSKIIVSRSQSYGGRHETGQSSPIKEHTIRFALPGSSKTFSWTNEYSQDLGHTNFTLLALHVLDGTPYVVVSPNRCLSYNKWGRPNPPYVFFKYEGSAWRRIPLEQFPTEFKKLNVAIYLGSQTVSEMVSLGVVSAEKIDEWNAELRQPEYKTILREPLIKVHCRVEFSNGKGTWLSSDWFSSEKDLAACMRVCEIKDFQGSECPCGQFFKVE